jgi:cytidylate kinase
MPVSEKVSEVSANKSVRRDMVKQQQRMGKSKNIVMDGRDIGTAVFEDAQVKFS